MIEDGITSLTVMLISVVVLPPVFIATIVYVVNGEMTIGVPVISPVVGLMLKPVGNDGVATQVTTGPPLAVGVIGVIAVPFVSIKEVVL